MAERIKVLVKHPSDKLGVMRYAANTLECLQRLVGGPIEVIPLGGGAVMIMNEEGKLAGLPINLILDAGGCLDPVVGNVVVCGTDGDEFADIPFDIYFWRIITKQNGKVDTPVIRMAEAETALTNLTLGIKLAAPGTA